MYSCGLKLSGCFLSPTVSSISLMDLPYLFVRMLENVNQTLVLRVLCACVSVRSPWGFRIWGGRMFIKSLQQTGTEKPLLFKTEAEGKARIPTRHKANHKKAKSPPLTTSRMRCSYLPGGAKKEAQT